MAKDHREPDDKHIYPEPSLNKFMKGTVIVFIALVFSLLVTTGCISLPNGPSAQPATTTPQEVRPYYIIGVDGDFPPFTSKDSGGNFSGLDIDAARWIAEKKGFQVQFVAVPWDNIVPSLEAGTIDIIWSGMTVSDERQAKVNFSKPYYSVNQSIAVRAGSPVTMQDLYNGRLRIGVQTGSTEADWVIKNLIQTGKMPASNLSQYPDITILTNNLENRTVDASIIQVPSQQRAISGRSLVIIGTTPSQDLYAVAIRKTDPKLLAIIDDGLLQLMKDPYWQKLKQKYDLKY
jgi:polar amino acid transport system substrate-binding protein